MLSPSGQDDRIELVSEILDRNILANFRAGHELHPFGGHLLETAIDHMLFQLELGDAVAEQTANAIGFFVNYDGVSGATELLGGGQSSWAGADDGYLFPGAHLSRLGTNPAFLKSTLDNAL